MMRSYSELILRDEFDTRFEYLSLRGTVAETTFGWERYLNQAFYASWAWKKVRDVVIIRDDGCDMGVPGFGIPHRIIVHHINPIVPSDLDPDNFNPDLLDPENLICVSHDTHNAIHYGDERHLPRQLVERRPGDTIPWR